MESLPTVDVVVSRSAAWTVQRVRSQSRLFPRSSYSDLELSRVFFLVEVGWVIYIEDEFLVPARIKVFRLGLNPLPLPLEVDLNEGTRKPVAVFGHQAACVVNFHHEFSTGHG
ncbi:hypothetical protein PS1_003526 [Malus domestica]